MRAVVVALLALLALPGAARAQMVDVGRALRIDPVYVDPDAELAGQVNEDWLRDRIVAKRAAPLFIAVLPASDAHGSPEQTLTAMRKAVGEKGTYALVVGNALSTSSDFYTGAPQAGGAARTAHPDDAEAALETFIDRTAVERADDGRDHGGAGALLVLLALLAVVLGGGALLVTRRSRRARTTAREEMAGG